MAIQFPMGQLLIRWSENLTSTQHNKKEQIRIFFLIIYGIYTGILCLQNFLICDPVWQNQSYSPKHTCLLNLVYLLLHMSYSDSVSFIRIASDLVTSEQNFIWILALQMTLWNFKHVKLGQILTGYKTGFVRPDHIFYC